MSGTRWLDVQEQQVWRQYLAATRLLAQQLDRELQQDSQLPHGYYEILVRLSEAPDRALRMSELADVSESSRSRLSHAVSRLVEKGWVRRQSCETDRRGAFAVLTDAGFAALEAAAPAHVESVRRPRFDPLSAEQVAPLGQICAAVVTGMRQSCAEAGHELPADVVHAAPDLALDR